MISTKMPPSLKQTARPWQATAAIALIGLNIGRLSSGVIAVQALSGAAPLIQVIGGVGDFLAGLSVPLVLWGLLRRPGVGSWTGAITWTVYALTDFIFANAANLIATRGQAYSSVNGAVVPVTAGWYVFLGSAVVLHLIIVLLLVSKRVRSYYLSSLN